MVSGRQSSGGEVDRCNVGRFRIKSSDERHGDALEEPRVAGDVQVSSHSQKTSGSGRENPGGRHNARHTSYTWVHSN